MLVNAVTKFHYVNKKKQKNKKQKTMVSFYFYWGFDKNTPKPVLELYFSIAYYENK